MHQLYHLALAAALRRADLDLSSPPSGKPFFKQSAVLKVGGNVDLDRNERRIHVVLLEDRTKKFTGIKAVLVLPEQLALVDNPAPAHVEDRYRDHVLFVVIPKDIDVVIAHDGHLLTLGKRFHGLDRVSIMRCDFVLFIASGFLHFRLEPLDQIVISALE